MSKKIDFSVIVPCYNQEKYLHETLSSVLQQTYENWECIIINDGSTDDSEKIIDEFCKKDSRFVKINQKNQGLAKSRNNGINLANGEFILPLDGDDKIGHQYMEFAKKAFDRDSSLKLVYAKANYFGAKNEYWDLPLYNYETLIFVNCIYCSAFYKKSDFLKTEGYDSNMKYGYEDWEFWLQLLKKEDKVYRINSIQFYYRQREESMISFLMDDEKRNEMEKYIFEKHRHVYRELLQDVSKMQNLLEINNNLNTLETIKKSFSYKTFYKIERKIRRLFSKK